MKRYPHPTDAQVRKLSGTPLQKAAYQAGGTLSYAPLPSREKFKADLDKYAPGCGSPTPVFGTSGTIPCGARFNGKPYLCPACQVVETLLDDPARKPWWKRDAEKRHQDELERIRGRYGRASDKAKPTPRQVKLIALWKRQGKDRRIIDYCDREKIDPNRVLSRLKESERADWLSTTPKSSL